MTSRIDKILAMLEAEPNDEFLRYTLALEYRKEGRTEESISMLKELALRGSPRHVQSFFMAAQQLAETDRINEARELLRDGIEEARAQNNLHAAAEMSELLSELGQYPE